MRDERSSAKRYRTLRNQAKHRGKRRRRVVKKSDIRKSWALPEVERHFMTR